MNEAPTLTLTPTEQGAMDYASLRAEGIRHLERMAGPSWTDFNTHDPGITILEQLCYALTDLGYRTGYDIKELLASDDGQDPYGSLYGPREILSTHPVTLRDLRKIVIDVPGVKNAWIEPVETLEPEVFYDASDDGVYVETTPHRKPILIRGGYQVLVETDGTKSGGDEVIPEVRRRLHAHRQLCQDFGLLKILPPQLVRIRVDIEVGHVEAPEPLLARIYQAVSSFISPHIRFFTLGKMLERGKSMEAIFNGPALDHGFIDDDELDRFERKRALRTSDLVQVIMGVKGVRTIRDICLASGDQEEDWYLPLDARSTPILDIGKSTIRLVRGPVIAQPNLAKVLGLFDDLQQSPKPITKSQSDVQIPVGRNRKIAHYRSIQHQFPPIYGIGEMGLTDCATPQRRSMANQLKAYLMFYDQLLANSFAQLANAKELLSFHTKGRRSYFPGTIDDIFPGLDQNEDTIRRKNHRARLQLITENPYGHKELLLSSTSVFGEQLDNEELPDDLRTELRNGRVSISEHVTVTILTAESEWLVTDDETGEHYLLIQEQINLNVYSLTDFQRKSRFLDHLLARFGEQLTDHAFLSSDLPSVIQTKRAFLQNYIQIGSSRSRGFNYTVPSWETDNVSGLEQRINRKLGLRNDHRRTLWQVDADDAGGFHMLEHILLRPAHADREQWVQAELARWRAAALLTGTRRDDPYSARISFVFPDWIERFQDENFRSFIDKTLRDQTPAHLHVELHWLNRDDMRCLEEAYQLWLTSLERVAPTGVLEGVAASDALDIPGRDARDQLINLLGIAVTYPLRDLTVRDLTAEGSMTVAHGLQAELPIADVQVGVRYQLCDKDGNLIPEKNGERFEAFKGPNASDNDVVLRTPSVTKDVTYTIRATRESAKAIGTPDDTSSLDGNIPAVSPAPSNVSQPIIVETYLNQAIAIKAGINTNLPVSFVPGDQQISTGQAITIDYNQSVTVKIENSQEGVSYRLFEDLPQSDTDRPLSEEVNGNKGDIEIDSTELFLEDTSIKVKAVRIGIPSSLVDLTARLTVTVRPDPSVSVVTASLVLDYDTQTRISLVNHQTSVIYQLYKREIIVPDEYVSQGGLIVPVVGDRQVFIKPPEKILDWENPNGFVEVGTFEATSDQIDTGNLAEDTLFIVRATKRGENGETLQLDQTIAILVRPNPSLQLSVEKSPIDPNDIGVVLINATQKGVFYQLRLDADNTPIKPPGYHVEDRGVERTRLEVDFVVGAQEPPGAGGVLRLPTDPLTEKTVFNVLATKIMTGLEAQLTGKATIDVQLPTPPNP